MPCPARCAREPHSSSTGACCPHRLAACHLRKLLTQLSRRYCLADSGCWYIHSHPKLLRVLRSLHPSSGSSGLQLLSDTCSASCSVSFSCACHGPIRTASSDTCARSSLASAVFRSEQRRQLILQRLTGHHDAVRHGRADEQRVRQEGDDEVSGVKPSLRGPSCRSSALPAQLLTSSGADSFRALSAWPTMRCSATNASRQPARAARTQPVFSASTPHSEWCANAWI